MVEGCEEELSTGNNSSEIITEERTVVLDELDDTHQLAQAAEQMRKEQLPDGSERILHANYLRQSNPRVSAVGIICDGNKDVGQEDFGQVECQPENDMTERTADKINALGQIDLEHLNLKKQQELRAILKKLASLFNDKPWLCKLDTIELSTGLQGDVCPRRQKPYRVPQLFKEEVDCQIDQWLADGLIEESNSP